MCGIFALLLNRPLSDSDIDLGRRGTGALHHRGPDGEGEWFDREKGVYLGHRRLAIIDLSPANAQPLRRDGTAIVHNGEIYNFQALRRELADEGRLFSTSGDVEVLLRAWQRWGASSLDRLDGMFAFVIWDGHQAHVATDAFGEKPLYCAETADGLYLSSEIAPLAELLNLKPALQGEDLAAFLSLGYVLPPATAYPAIKRLAAAIHMVAKDGRIQHSRRYWTPPQGVAGRAAAQALGEADLDRLQEALSDSVAGRLIADVPLCLFLSQGIDSALVAAMAVTDHGARPECLTVAFPHGWATNEGPGAAKIAAHLGLDHQILESHGNPADVSFDKVIDIYGQPCETVTSISVRHMSRTAAEHYKVALSGVGGDEIFMGYGKNAYFYKMRRLYRLPEILRRVIGVVARRTSSLDARLERLGYDICTANEERYIANKNFPAIEWLRCLDGFTSWCKENFDGSESLEHMVARFEIETAMPAIRLTTFDHSSMKAGLELRTPFLNRKIVESVAEFDPRSLTAFGQKGVLRRIAARYFPKPLIDHPKAGFRFPVDRILDSIGDRPSTPVGLTDDLVSTVWQRRRKGPTWRRLAVRLGSLDAFFRREADRLAQPLDTS